MKLACFTYDYLLPVLNDEEDTELFLQSHEISSVEGLIFVSDLRGKKVFCLYGTVMIFSYREKELINI